MAVAAASYLPVVTPEKDAGPRDDVLADLKPGLLLEQFQEFLVVAGRLAVLGEFERLVIILGRDGHVAALLDLGEGDGLGRARHGQDGCGAEQHSATSETMRGHGGSSCFAWQGRKAHAIQNQHGLPPRRSRGRRARAWRAPRRQIQATVPAAVIPLNPDRRRSMPSTTFEPAHQDAPSGVDP
jgi:hypothetical protein